MVEIYVARPVVEINSTPSGVQGEINTASNLGVGTGLFSGKVGVDLQFKSLVAGAGIILTNDSTTVTITGNSTLVTPQLANLVFAGPASGIPAIPTFRSLTNTDLPIVAATKGGTGQILYTIGDLLYADTTTTLAKRSATTNGFVLTLSAGLPIWAAPTGGLITASNGLTAVGSDVQLGGTLTSAISITGSTVNTFKLIFNSLATTQINGAGAWYQNTTAAAAGAQQISPSISWEGQGWKTNATAGSQAVSFTSYVIPVQGASNPTATWNLAGSINGGSYGTILQVGGIGASTIAGASTLFLISSITPTGGNKISIRDFNNAQDNMAMIVDAAGTGEGRWLVGGSGTFATMYSSGVEALRISTIQNISIGSTTVNAAKLYIVQSALAASWIPTAKFISGNDTAKTAATEFPDFIFGGASGDANTAVSTRTSTWLAGTVATQRSNYFKGTVLTGASATATFTNAYTVYIDPPTVGSNAVITSNYALGLGGSMQMVGPNFFHSGGSTFLFGSSAQSVFFYSGGIQRLSMNSAGTWQYLNGPTSASTPWITYTQSVHTSGNPTGLLFIGAAHTGLTLSTESIDINWNLSRIVQFATGALTTQRAFLIQAPTYAFVGSSTITTAGTFVVTGAPTAGTNATITNSYSIWAQAGITYLQGGVRLTNTSTAGQVWTASDSVGNGSWTAIPSIISNTSITASQTIPTSPNRIYYVFVDATAGNVVLTLPTGDQTVYHVIKRVDSTANTVTFTGANIDGSATYPTAAGIPVLGTVHLGFRTNFYDMKR